MLRRRLLAAGLLTLTGGLPVRAAPDRPSAATDEETLWDVLIVGAGGAGLAAAVAAKEAGAQRVAVFEKRAVIGGHTMLAAGTVTVAGGSREADPAAAMAREIVEAGGNPELAEVMARESSELPVWFSGMGVKWEPKFFRAVGAVSARNMSTGSIRGGYEFIQALNTRARALGVRIFLSTDVTDLLRTGDNISGVVTRTPDGFEAHHRARTVILATGGFGANTEMRMRFNPTLDSSYRTTADAMALTGDGATGDGIRMAVEVGAALADMEAIELIPYNGGRVLDYSGADMWLNSEGERFVDETLDFHSIQEALTRQPGHTMWVLTDAKSKKGVRIDAKLAAGIVMKADTLGEAARAMKIPESTLRKTLDDYNCTARGQKADPFGRTLFTQTIDTPPYYFGAERLGIHLTSGGIVISPRAEVLDTRSQPIPGLFAAGETTGGLHGVRRLSGNALTDAFVFGRIAGREAAKKAAEKAGIPAPHLP